MHVEAVRLNAVTPRARARPVVGRRGSGVDGVVGRRARSPRRRRRRRRPRMHPCPAVTYAPPQALARAAQLQRVGRGRFAKMIARSASRLRKKTPAHSEAENIHSCSTIDECFPVSVAQTLFIPPPFPPSLRSSPSCKLVRRLRLLLLLLLSKQCNDQAVRALGSAVAPPVRD